MDASSIWISLKTASTATVVTFIGGVLAARWRVSRRGGWGGLLDVVLLLPLALPPTVVGLVLLTIFGRSSPVGRMLAELGLTLVFTWPAAALAAAVVAFPIMYLTTRAGFQQINQDLLDMARLDGLSEWRILWQVMLPLAWPALAAGVALSFVRALGEFGATLMIAGNIPGRTQTMPVAIFFSVEAGKPATAWTLAAITIAISCAAIMTINFLQRRYSVEATG
jgi:molybdate transport system permease protein